MKFPRFLITLILLLISSFALVQAQDESPNAYSVNWSPNGRWIAANTTMGLWLFEVENPEAEAQIFFEGEMVYNIEFSPDGNYLAALIDNDDDYPPYLRLIELETGEVTADWMLDYYFVNYDMLYSTNGETIVLAMDSLVLVYNAETGELVNRIETGGELAGSTEAWGQIASTGNYAAANWNSDFVMVNDEGGLLESHNISELGAYAIYAIEHLEASRFLVHAGDGMYVFDMGDETLELLIPASEEANISGYAYFPESELLVVGDAGLWRSFDMASNEVILEVALENSEERPFFFDFNPDGSQFVSLQTDGVITVWDTESGEALYSLGEFENAFSNKWG